MKINAVCFSYPHSKHNIIDHLSYHIKPNIVTAIVGPNGSGKTTLLRMLARELIPTSGNIQLNQREISNFSNKEYAQKVAIVHQHNPIYEDISVIDLVRFGRTPYGSALNTATDDSILPILEYLELVPLKQRSMLSLSGGQQQRVWLAMALAQQPEYLLLDEPTTYLDLHFQASLMKLIARLNTDFNITVIMIVHDLNQALHYSQRTVVINHGKIIASGDPTRVLTQETLQNVFQIDADVVRTERGEFILQMP
ncbi:iron ABC transporter ATP-binding protein [Paucilactobacillus hokkaidonensis JCM 18461]|uniref:Iron ABC transporter ATP-binding protein n=2 Tax=Paucilactobacillus hokkaidonensis TaxID=1193095 RepID=A0A0A1GVI6_9LACO|nr:ABC transporter ATP-binding protein [Paucilactobacillus hokkaidonensis]KRO10241.1 iron compound ABC transporter, ATP-binding protein [Paucilactobacillus hokkaidonensis]BAP86257.1 iron ABC transporter ATP-binding protein [Paucilactobacillus hokkaidonensis JCM 18461]